MSFGDCDEALGSGTFFRLESDGDDAVLIFVHEPFPREGDFKGVKRTQYCFPIVTEDGLQVWTVGATLYKMLRDSWTKFVGKPQKVVRRGKAGSTDTTYDFTPTKGSAALRKLKAEVTTGDIDELFLQVTSVRTTDGDADKK